MEEELDGLVCTGTVTSAAVRLARPPLYTWRLAPWIQPPPLDDIGETSPWPASI